jgi:hypothetical protein
MSEFRDQLGKASPEAVETLLKFFDTEALRSQFAGMLDALQDEVAKRHQQRRVAMDELLAQLTAKREAEPEQPVGPPAATEDIAPRIQLRGGGACPEQYDAFVGERQVGYFRLRHGDYRVDYPDAHETTIYKGWPMGDGEFMDDERDAFLAAGVTAIQARLEREGILTSNVFTVNGRECIKRTGDGLPEGKLAFMMLTTAAMNGEYLETALADFLRLRGYAKL